MIQPSPDCQRHISRMAAVLVLAAGGEIRITQSMLLQQNYIELEQQDDPRTGAVTYRARLGGRHAPSKTPDADFTVVSDETALPAPARLLPAPKGTE